CYALLHEGLQLPDCCFIAGCAVAQHDRCVHDHPPVGIGLANHRALHHIRMLFDRALDLGGGDVVPGRHDDVVAAALVPQVPVGVPDVRVTGDVPAVLDVRRLPRVGQVPAAGGADGGQLARRPVGYRLPVGPDHLGAVAGDGLARRSRADVLVGGGDEDMQHLGAADA